MKPIQIQLREFLGAKEYNRFSETVLYPLIERLSEEGRLTTHDLARLAHYTKHDGAGVFDVWAADTGEATLHSLREGAPIIARKQVGDEEIRLFVKQFSDRKSYERGVTIQDKLVEHFKGTELEGIVPSQSYRNPRKRVVVMPLVEGETLDRAITDENRNTQLARTIDAYVRTTDEVERAGIFTVPERGFFGKVWYEDFELPKLEDFTEFFAKGFEADEELKKVYEEEVGKRLRGQTKEFIHGDLQPRNVLVNKDVHIIDWEMAKKGFMEFDLYKLFTKSRVGREMQEALTAYAATKKALLKAERSGIELSDLELDEIEREAIQIYTLNQLTQDLLTAERYAKRARESKNRKQELEQMALTAYNIALRNILYAESKNRITENFKKAIERHAAEKKPHFKLVDDKEFEKLLENYDPHSTASQENIVSHASEMPVAGIDSELKKQHLRTICRSLRKKDWGRIAQVAGAVALVGGLAGFGGVKYYESEAARRKIAAQQREELTEDLYRSDFRSGYNELIRAQLLGGISDRYGADKKPIKRVSPLQNWNKVEEVCKKNGLPKYLAQAMYSVNECYANVDETAMDMHGLSLFDPYRSWAIHDSKDPQDNLIEGATRLSNLLDKYNVDRTRLFEAYKDNGPGREKIPGLKEALTRFYYEQKGNSGRTPDERWEDDKTRGIPESVRKIVWNVLRGGVTGDMYSTWLDDPPKDFRLD